MRLFLLFVLAPIAELWLLIKVGGLIGAGPTVGLVLLTGFVGAYLARQQGLRVLREFSAATAQGKVPAAALFNGVAVFVGGAFLLTPGIITDCLGFALLIPGSRQAIQRLLFRVIQRKIKRGEAVMFWPRAHRPSEGSPQVYDDTLEDSRRDQ